MNTTLRIAQLLRIQPTENKIEIKGWLKTIRGGKNFSFLEINDGSCLANLQVIVEADIDNYKAITQLTTGASLRVYGTLVESPAKGQTVELQAAEVEIYGLADPESYPLQKKRHSFEFLRTISHLRPRTNSLGAVTRVRSNLSFAVHQFFKERGFFYIHTPIISTSDCEGAGEMFTVTTLDISDPPKENGKVQFSKDFFGTQAGLTVSGQLEAEVYAMSLGNVYTFGPTFRAENSNTSRHLAEFWMVEPEMAFCDLDGDIEIAENFLTYLINYVLENCEEDIGLFNRFIDKTLVQRLQAVIEKQFARVSYTEAVEILQQSNKKFNFQVQWGVDLQSEHERFLTEDIFKRPVIVTDYPTSIKPFYMRKNDDGKTVAAMDILFPTIGEIIGGSQREERHDILQQNMTAMNLNHDEYSWYLDLRRYGTAEHAGFGLGFERMVQFVTGMANIRDVIPFPRTPGSASY